MSGVSPTRPATDPSMGERASKPSELQTALATPSRCRMAFASFAAVIVLLRFSNRGVYPRFTLSPNRVFTCP